MSLPPLASEESCTEAEVIPRLVNFLRKTPDNPTAHAPGVLFNWSHRVSCLLAAEEREVMRNAKRPETYGALADEIERGTPVGNLFVKATTMEINARRAYQLYRCRVSQCSHR
jgi:hypothetical protein